MANKNKNKGNTGGNNNAAAKAKANKEAEAKAKEAEAKVNVETPATPEEVAAELAAADLAEGGAPEVDEFDDTTAGEELPLGAETTDELGERPEGDELNPPAAETTEPEELSGESTTIVSDDEILPEEEIATLDPTIIPTGDLVEGALPTDSAITDTTATSITEPATTPTSNIVSDAEVSADEETVATTPEGPQPAPAVSPAAAVANPGDEFLGTSIKCEMYKTGRMITNGFKTVKGIITTLLTAKTNGEYCVIPSKGHYDRIIPIVAESKSIMASETERKAVALRIRLKK